MNHTLSLIIYINVAYHFTQAPCNTMCTDVNCWLFFTSKFNSFDEERSYKTSTFTHIASSDQSSFFPFF